MIVERTEPLEWVLRAVSHGFETPPDRLRQIRARWVPYFQHCQLVLDVGCGEGVLLELLREANIPAVGVEIDVERVAIAQAKGLHVEHALAQDYLVDKPDAFDGIFLGHLIEHLSGKEALDLLYHCCQALRPGGTLIILTPNFQHLDVAGCIFWLDITHQRPYPLPLLEHIFAVLGLEVREKGLQDEMNQYIVGRLPPSSHFGIGEAVATPRERRRA